jgi:hypothetical protein
VKASAKLGPDRDRAVKDREEMDANDLRALLALPEGKRFLWRLLDSCKLYESPFNGNGSIQAQNIGRGDVGRQIVAWLAEVDPVAYPTLCIEMGRKVENE